MLKYRLGRLPHDAVRLAATPTHRFGMSPAVPVVDRSAIDVTPRMFANDRYGDCTCVALANCARGIAALNGYALAVDDVAPLELYAAVLGNPPNLMATDGAVALDVLGYQARNGFAIGPQRLVARFGAVSPQRHALANGIDRLGGGYWGVTLREREMETFDVWNVQAGRDDGMIVGGHMVNAWDYTGLGDADTVRIGTWGRWQRVTWAWIEAQLDEAYGLVFRQLARAQDSRFYNGLTADGLSAELMDHVDNHRPAASGVQAC